MEDWDHPDRARGKPLSCAMYAKPFHQKSGKGKVCCHERENKEVRRSAMLQDFSFLRCFLIGDSF